MKYKLRKNQEAFETVDGEFAGRKYRHGVVYLEIPASEKARFEIIEPVVETPKLGVSTDKPAVKNRKPAAKKEK